jgi:two-component system OmpR family response regulator
MRILLADDDPLIRRLIRKVLSTSAHVVDEAKDGIEALRLASDKDYDLAILDISMPGLSGVEVTTQLRVRERWLPVLLLTGVATDSSDVAAGLDGGADDFLKKPFAMDELEARVRALTRRKLDERPTVLQGGGLTLDPSTRTVCRGDVEIDLTAKEFALLHLFMRRPNKVMSRATIRAAVSGLTDEQPSNVVDVHVSHLRNKIDRPFGTDSIQAVYGIGYRFDP